MGPLRQPLRHVAGLSGEIRYGLWPLPFLHPGSGPAGDSSGNALEFCRCEDREERKPHSFPDERSFRSKSFRCSPEANRYQYPTWPKVGTLQYRRCPPLTSKGSAIATGPYFSRLRRTASQQGLAACSGCSLLHVTQIVGKAVPAHMDRASESIFGAEPRRQVVRAQQI